MRFIRAVVISFCVLFLAAAPAYAQFTILPVPEKGTDCKVHLEQYEVSNDQPHFFVGKGRENTLGCAIQTGRISLNMIPYFVTYIANFLLSLVGLICVLFIVIGGYQYIAGGLTEQKEKGKKTISHALMGMVVAILSWVIVNLVITAVTQ